MTTEEKRIYKAAWRAANPGKVRAQKKAWRAANHARVLAKDAAWRSANPEKVRVYSLKWYRANRERANARQAAYHVANKDKDRLRNLAWAAAHPERSAIRYAADPKRARAFCFAWAQANPEKVCALTAKRRANRLRATPAWLTPEQDTHILDWYRRAKERGLTVDHIIPLSGKMVCGLHVPWNLALLSAVDNSKKGNRIT